MGSYLQYHRRKSGLTRDELAQIVGVTGARQVARHEAFEATPSIFAAIGYHIALQVSIAELFPGLYDSIQHGVEQRICEFEARLKQGAPQDQMKEQVDSKLLWCRERRRSSNLFSPDARIV